MQLEDYFDFLAPNDIRVKGTRVGIETILYDFIHRSRTPETIAQTYPSLTLEQVYAAILYYHHERDKVETYLTDWLEWSRRMREEQARNPSPDILRLREIKTKRETLRRELGREVTIEELALIVGSGQPGKLFDQLRFLPIS
ncbi:MAG: DUF433 domain-containing protein [Chloroflexi bacterium]|nr:DUF433 domain-containing protein [Chloroflexota bacterium]